MIIHPIAAPRTEPVPWGETDPRYLPAAEQCQPCERTMYGGGGRALLLPAEATATATGPTGTSVVCAATTARRR
jgi:hypothetical protein